MENSLNFAAFRDAGDNLLCLGKALEGVDLTVALQLQAGVQNKAACLQDFCALQIEGFNVLTAVCHTDHLVQVQHAAIQEEPCSATVAVGAGNVGHKSDLAVIDQVVLPEGVHKGIYSCHSCDSFRMYISVAKYNDSKAKIRSNIQHQ